MFDYITHHSVDPSKRKALTLAAQKGDESATLALMADLKPNLVSICNRYARMADVEELESAAAEAFLIAIKEYDPSRDRDGVGVVALLSERVMQGVTRAVNVDTFSDLVPWRTLMRFWSIYKMAEGDRDAGARLAPEYSMKAETFLAVYNLSFGNVAMAEVEEYGTVDAEVAMASVEDRLMADQALASLDDPTDIQIVKRAYGFYGFRPESDAAIADALDMSRQAVHRRRTKSLKVMREAIGIG